MGCRTSRHLDTAKKRKTKQCEASSETGSRPSTTAGLMRDSSRRGPVQSDGRLVPLYSAENSTQKSTHKSSLKSTQKSSSIRPLAVQTANVPLPTPLPNGGVAPTPVPSNDQVGTVPAPTPMPLHHHQHQHQFHMIPLQQQAYQQQPTLAQQKRELQDDVNKRRHRHRKQRRKREMNEDDTLYEVAKIMPTIDFSDQDDHNLNNVVQQVS